MTANLLNQIGLALGLFSGLLLIPEVINLIPIERFEKSMEKFLYRLGKLTKFPLNFHPPSWKRTLTEEQRNILEPITAVFAFVFSLGWIATLMTGIFLSSKFFVFLSITILFVGVLRNMIRPSVYFLHSSGVSIFKIFLFSFLIVTIAAPPISLMRVLLLILRAIVVKVQNFFSKDNALRALLIAIAIIAFIISNVLQFVATFYE